MLSQIGSDVQKCDGSAMAIAVASGKGGVGKTTVAVNLSIALANCSRSTILLDANLGLANVDFSFGLTPSKSLADVIQERSSLEEILVPGPGGIKIVPAGHGEMSLSDLGLIEQMGLISAFSNLRDRPDYMVIDVPPGTGTQVLGFCAAADVVLIVICDEIASLTHGAVLAKMLAHERGVERFHVICNRVTGAAHGRRLFEAFLKRCGESSDFGLHHVAAIPEDGAFVGASRSGQTLLEYDDSSLASEAITQLAKATKKLRSLGMTCGRQTFFPGRSVRGIDVLPRLEAN